MRVTAWLSGLLTTALAAPQSDSQALSSDLANWSSLGNALQSLNFNFTLPTKTANLDNISPPPRSLIPEVITALPPSVLMELIIPSQRSALASQFKAGSTPAWYASLPSDVQSYLSVVKSQISEGALTATTGLAEGKLCGACDVYVEGDGCSSKADGSVDGGGRCCRGWRFWWAE
ncbi:hypothetical protein CNMCM8812_006365 [Aspergillus fumigatus]|nr:hypothetical protein CNMCM8812_006365 [Aspergillus fumigatus]